MRPTQGEPLRDGPRALAALQPAPFSPVRFYEFMERERPLLSIIMEESRLANSFMFSFPPVRRMVFM